MQARSKPHHKGQEGWRKHMEKVASLLAAHGGPKSHLKFDHTDISACESLLENYFLLVR